MNIISLEIDRETAVEILSKWRSELSDLDGKRLSIISKIHALETKLGMRADSPPEAVTEPENAARSPRGENLRRVRECLASSIRASTGEIARALSLTASSVSSVLCHHPQYFIKEPDGQWALKPSTTTEET